MGANAWENDCAQWCSGGSMAVLVLAVERWTKIYEATRDLGSASCLAATWEEESSGGGSACQWTKKKPVSGWVFVIEQLPFFSQNWLRAFEDMKERKVLTSWDGRFVVHYGRKWRGRWRKWWEKRENERGWERKKWKMKKVGGADVFWGAKVRF